jgi:hypothetical protein
LNCTERVSATVSWRDDEVATDEDCASKGSGRANTHQQMRALRRRKGHGWICGKLLLIRLEYTRKGQGSKVEQQFPFIVVDEIRNGQPRS